MRNWIRPVLLILIIFCLLSCEKRIKRTENLVDYIPQNTESVVKIANMETTINDFSRSSLFSQMKQAVLYDFLKNESSFISQIKPKGESVLCFHKPNDSIRNFTIITRADPSVFVVDSLANTTSEKSDYKGYQIERIDMGSKKNYLATVDSVFIASSSELLVREIIDNKTETDPVFRKAFSLNTKDGLVTILRPDGMQINDSLTLNFASRAALELEVFPDGISASGVVLDRDTLPQFLAVFRGLHPQQNGAASIIPVDALQARAITYDDVQILEQNLQQYHKNSQALGPLFGSINEVIGIRLKAGNAVVLKSIDPDFTTDEFRRFISEVGSFREVPLFRFTDEKAIFAPFYPFIDSIRPGYAFQLDDFFVFTETETVANEIITAYKSSATLDKTTYFENTSLQLSQASSFIVYNLQGVIDTWLASFLSAEKSQLKKFPLAVLQLSYDRDFAHVNLVCKEISQAQQRSGVITQLFTRQLDTIILGNPQFFTNHRTKGKDVVVQDIENRLYLLSSGGKILWKKQLDGAILGNIREVDLLRNGKKQLAFNTRKTFYILDRNGKAVAPFPKKFKDEITQPLSLFDYDNKRNYRFVITQGKDIIMYDSKGKNVTGFTFTKATSKVVLPPQHIRMGNKDYILIAEENGKLNILSRVGKERVKVKKTFNFSDIPIAREGLNFVVITKEHSKESISQTGKVTSKALSVAPNYWFAIRGSTKVTLDDNLLRVNGKLVELPFGVYTKPHIFVTNRKTYITVNETQEKKIYVIDKAGNILTGFPIYGNGIASLGDAKNNRKNAVVVKGNENEVLLYGFD